ncbi:hypothetical protein BJV74DRAFT_780633, partial [Russula compacta]
YYQTVVGERYLVFESILVHTTSALLKRLFSSPQPPRPLPSALATTGHACALFLFPIHIFTHRLVPVDPAPPISSLTRPSSNFEYVNAALHGWAARSTMALRRARSRRRLACCRRIRGRCGPPGLQRPRRRKLPGRRARTGNSQAGRCCRFLTGLAVIAREPLFAFASTVARWRAVFAQSFLYSTACEKKY